MSHDVIIGSDGRPRCAWADDAGTPLGRYHYQVWGHRTYDQRAMFEALTLGVFQVGLSWSIVCNKGDAFRTAFHDFDIVKIAAMTDKDADRLTQDASIIRNRGKIQATVYNARAMLSASPGLAELARSYESTRQRSPRSIAAVPTSTPQAQAVSRRLKAQRYRFLGPTRVHPLRQSAGTVNQQLSTRCPA